MTATPTRTRRQEHPRAAREGVQSADPIGVSQQASQACERTRSRAGHRAVPGAGLACGEHPDHEGPFHSDDGDGVSAQLARPPRRPLLLRTRAVLSSVFYSGVHERPARSGLCPASSRRPRPTGPALCNQMPFRLEVGEGGRTTLYPRLNTSVRRAPGMDGPLFRRIPPGQTFEVSAGPVCANSIAWWEIKGYDLSGLWTGWIGEGQNGTYWTSRSRRGRSLVLGRWRRAWCRAGRGASLTRRPWKAACAARRAWRPTPTTSLACSSQGASSPSCRGRCAIRRARCAGGWCAPSGWKAGSPRASRASTGWNPGRDRRAPAPLMWWRATSSAAERAAQRSPISSASCVSCNQWATSPCRRS